MPQPSISEVIDHLDRDRDQHVLAETPTEAEIAAVEAALGRPLPADLRRLLARLGGGLLYQTHEMPGARTVFVHDIELLPDLARFAHGLSGKARPGELPFHQAGGDVHLYGPPGDDAIRALVGVRRWPDLAGFLVDVVLPAERHRPAH